MGILGATSRPTDRHRAGENKILCGIDGTKDNNIIILDVSIVSGAGCKLCKLGCNVSTQHCPSPVNVNVNHNKFKMHTAAQQ